MGSLDEAISVYVDSVVILDLIAELEELGTIEVLATALDEGTLRFVCSELVIIECLVHALRNKNPVLEDLIRKFLASSPKVVLIPISSRVLEAGVALRASHNLKTPDAIHIATASLARCDYILTRDSRWAKIVVNTIDVSALSKML